MKKKYNVSYQARIILLLLFIINIPFFLVLQVGTSLIEESLLHEKENKLRSFTHILDSRLGPGGYDEILQDANAQNATRKEKIAILQNFLQDIADNIANSSKGLGAGFYHKELDAILAYGPSSSLGHTVGTAIERDHPGREVMAENKAQVLYGHMVRGNILNAMLPIERNGEVLGYVWANELSEDISIQLSKIVRNSQIGLITSFILSTIVLFIVSRRITNNISSIVEGVHHLQKDSTYLLPPIKGTLGNIVTSINDLTTAHETATKQAEHAVAALQSVMSNLDVAIVVCDPKTHRLIYANPYVRKLWNMTESGEAKNAPCYALLYGRNNLCDDCPHEHFFKVDTPNYEPVVFEKHVPELKRDFLIVDRLISWHDGRNVHLRVGADVTERNALLAANSANRAQRDFLARMSHEIRTPMNGVLGMTRLAMQQNPSPDQMQYLHKIQSSASLLLGIINDILDFSRIEAGAMTIEEEPFQLHEAINKVYELVLPKVTESQTELEVHLDSSVPAFVMGDSLRISQVLLNLLGNAAKFTSFGKIDLYVRANTAVNGRLFVYCDIADTGIGMNEEQQKNLFKPFTQADNSTSRRFGGTGLGLSICKALIELMGGKLTVTSELDKGSTFSFFISLTPYDEENAAAIKQEHPWDGIRYDGYEFLLVEDNDINQEIALAILQEFGIKADVASDGKEAVAAFMQKDYALILMDIQMPVLDGFEATKAIRESNKHDAKFVPIVAMTANAMEEDRKETLAAGMQGHIAKPIDMEELKEVFYRCLIEKKNTYA